MAVCVWNGCGYYPGVSVGSCGCRWSKLLLIGYWWMHRWRFVLVLLLLFWLIGCCDLLGCHSLSQWCWHVANIWTDEWSTRLDPLEIKSTPREQLCFPQLTNTRNSAILVIRSRIYSHSASIQDRAVTLVVKELNPNIKKGGSSLRAMSLSSD